MAYCLYYSEIALREFSLVTLCNCVNLSYISVSLFICKRLLLFIVDFHTNSTVSPKFSLVSMVFLSFSES
jgi:hypothetical protein